MYRSVRATLMPSLTIFSMARSFSGSVGSRSKARAWRSVKSFARSASKTCAECFSIRSLFATLDWLFPMIRAACSWLIDHWVMSWEMPRASSIKSRSCRCRFSTSAAIPDSRSSMVMTMQGISVSPARIPARSRRSPAISS